jgi:hypothetical protein
LLNSTTIVYFQRDNNQANSFMSPTVADHLKKSYSGFYTNDPQYAGWQFLKSGAVLGADDSDNNYKNNSSSSASSLDSLIKPEMWVSGTNVIMSPPFTPSIFHHSQIFLALLHMIHRFDLSSGQECPWVRSIQRVLLPTIPRFDLQWSLALTKMVVNAAISKSTLRSPASNVQVYQKEDMDIFLKSNTLCFENLIVVGTRDLSTPFLTDESETKALSALVDEFLGEQPNKNSKGQNGRKDKNNKKSNDLKDISSSLSGFDSSPNRRLNVTILLRSGNRFILNLEEIFLMLNATGLVDPHMMRERVYFFDDNIWTVPQQIRIMRETDILISPHGAGLQNMIYMRPQSAVIEIMTSPWYETGYQCTALGMGLHYYVLPQPDIEMSFSCAVPSSCLETPLMVQRRSLHCYGMRSCNAVIDVGSLEIMVWQAAQAVRIRKRNLSKFRYSSSSDSGTVGGDDNNGGNGGGNSAVDNEFSSNGGKSKSILVYRKSYELALL